VSRLKNWIKNYLLTGLIVVVPVAITVFIIRALIGVMDEFLSVEEAFKLIISGGLIAPEADSRPSLISPSGPAPVI
jgi:uncharacterized membrane protein